MLREIAGNALKIRQKQSPAELREKLQTWHHNPPQVDRRLRELSAPGRTLLALLFIGKRTQWRVGTMLELLSCLHGLTADSLAVDGLKTIEELFLQGMIIPVASPERKKFSSFEEWLGQGSTQQFRVWVAPEIVARAAGDFAALPDLETTAVPAGLPAREADGLEWFIRLGVAWQMIHDSPARLTQQGAFFKRDQDRLTDDILLNQPLHDAPESTMPQQGHLVMALGLALGLLKLDELQVVADRFPESWQAGWKPAITHMIGVLSELSNWSVSDGWRGVRPETNPWPSCTILILSLLSRLESSSWTSTALIADWLARHHCFWASREFPPDLNQQVNHLLVNVLAPLRLVQARMTEDLVAVQLTPLGRVILTEKGDVPLTDFPKMMLVQPNLEMVAYRQGMNPRLVAQLSQCASWKSLGAACMLTIDQHSVHRGLEAGDSFESLSTLFEQHCVHPPPSNVIEALRTWAAKRDRLAVYQGVNLLEFVTRADLDDALSRGLKGVALADRYLLIENEDDLDYRHFRTLGTRDYTLPPTQCVSLADDGVTLSVDQARADLLLETELLRFSVPIVLQDARQYRMTFATLDQARAQGLSLRFLEDWFLQRTGQPLSMAARLLWSDRPSNRLTLESALIVRVAQESMADGLWQWPETRSLLQERLGPCVFLVTANQVAALNSKLKEIDLQLAGEHTLEIKASA